METEKEFIQGFKEQFSDIEDPRQLSKVAHPLMEIFFLAILAVAGGATSWSNIQMFGKIHLSVLMKYYPFEMGIPSKHTIRRVFEMLDPKYMNQILLKFFSKNLNESHFAIDGKALRGSRYKESRAIHFLNVYAVNSGLTLFGKAIDRKDNEITAIPEAIECLSLKGAVVTIDAMGCQKSITKQIIEKEGDYVLSLKENHPTLYNQVVCAFAAEAIMDP